MVKFRMQFLKIEFLKLSPNLRKNAKSFLEKTKLSSDCTINDSLKEFNLKISLNENFDTSSPSSLYGFTKLGSEKLIQEYDIRCEGPFASTRLLSGGNIQKLILARSLSNNPRFIIANKPARGLDEGAISFVQQQIVNAKTKGAGVLLISEDLDEIFELSDRIAVIFDGKIQGPFDSNKVSINEVGLMMSGEMKADSVYEN